MRILLATPLYPPEIGGPATHAEAISRLLPKKDCEVTVLPFSRVRRFPKGISHVVYLWHILRGARHADLIYALDAYSVGIPAFLAAFILRKRFIVRVPGDTVWELYIQRRGYIDIEAFQKKVSLGFVYGILRFMERTVARRAEKVIVPSKFLKKIVGLWGVREGNTHIVYSSFSDNFEPANSATIRGMLNFSGVLIVSVGRLVSWKGFDMLIEIVPDIVKDFSDMKLLIIGDGPDMERLEAKIDALGIRDIVSLTGRVAHAVLLRYVQIADVFVLNTGYEGFSHQILEVMNVGVPIITTKVGGNPELVEDGKNGLLVGYNDKEELKKALVSVLKNKKRAERLVSEGKTTVGKYTDEKMVDLLTPLLTVV